MEQPGLTSGVGIAQHGPTNAPLTTPTYSTGL